MFCLQFKMAGLVFIVLIAALIFWAANHYGVLPEPRTDGIDPQVLRATKGDRELAKRLMRRVRLKFPDKDEQWHVEKVLYDLERDGHYVPRRRSAPRVNFSRAKRRDMMEDMWFVGTVIWFVSLISGVVEDIFRRLR